MRQPLEVRPAVVARDLPDPSYLSDGALFAWEIMRRRADYRADPKAQVATHLGHRGQRVVTIEADTPPGRDLLFRRRWQP